MVQDCASLLMVTWTWSDLAWQAVTITATANEIIVAFNMMCRLTTFSKSVVYFRLITGLAPSP